MRATTCVGLIVALSLLAASVAGGGARAGPPLRVVLYDSIASVDVKTDNLECALRFRSTYRYRWRSLRGFAARLTREQVRRLRLDHELRAINANPTRYVVGIGLFPASPAVEQAIRTLERRHRFRASYRYNAKALRGFAAALTARQLSGLAGEPLVANVASDAESYLVFYARGTDVEARTDELERKYGFQATVRLRGLEGFAARLRAPQLAELAGEPDIDLIGARGYAVMSVADRPPQRGCRGARPRPAPR